MTGNKIFHSQVKNRIQKNNFHGMKKNGTEHLQ